nr:hypothetical protein [Mycoplasmopsis bovis]
MLIITTNVLDDTYKYRSIFYNLSKAIIYFTLYDNMNIYGMDELKNSTKAIGKYALDNNIKRYSIQWKWQRWTI